MGRYQQIVNDLISLLRIFEKVKILVYGDLMLDEFLWGKAERLSPEAPVPVVQIEKVTYVPGGAANVAANVVSLGGKSTVVGVPGADAQAIKLRETLDQYGVNARLVVDSRRPTTLKTRIIVGRQQLMRLDKESRLPLSPRLLSQIEDALLAEIPAADAILVSDYAKGAVVPRVMDYLVALALQHDKPVIVGPKGSNASKYQGVTAILPNEQELSQLTGKKLSSDRDIAKAMDILRHKTGAKAVLTTLGSKGMALLDQDKGMLRIPALAREVSDVTGAGDTVAAAFALSLAAGSSFKAAALLANYAASIAVGHLGTAAVKKEELQNLIKQEGDKALVQEESGQPKKGSRDKAAVP